MESIWGKLKVPTSIQLKSSVPDKPITKSRIRQQVWDFLEEHDLVNFPRPVHKRIPNFKGAATAGLSLASLPEFKKANVIKVNPDKPQEEVRFQVLDHKKTLLVPTPRLKSGLFNLIENPGGDSHKEYLRMLASRQGIDNRSKPLPLSYKTDIDLVVIGSVAVDKLGQRIGKGEGFADLEFAMGVSIGAITKDTIVIATVHDCQLFDSFPEEIFGEHDITVDIIVTPTIIHRVENRLPKPTKLIWEMITADRLKRNPVLKQIKEAEERREDGVQLNGDVDTEKTKQKDKIANHRKESKEERKESVGKNTEENGISKDKEKGGKTVRENKDEPKEKMNKTSKRANLNYMKAKQKANMDKNGDDEFDGNMESDYNDINPKQKERIARSMNDYEEIFDDRPLLYVGKIPRNARVRELKDAINERDVKLKQLVWKGYRGFAFLYFDVSEDIETIFEALKDLKLGDAVLDIQREKYKD